MKFDLIISNPPYNRRLDLKILESVDSLGEKICLVHPCDYIFRNQFSLERQEEYDFLEDSPKLFGVSCYVLSVHTISSGYKKILRIKGKDEMIFENSWDVNPLGTERLETVRKMLRYLRKQREHSLLNKIVHTQEERSWYCTFPKKINTSSTRYLTLFAKSDKSGNSGRVSEENIKNYAFKYETREEALEMEKFLKSRLTRCLFYLQWVFMGARCFFLSLDSSLYEDPTQLASQIGLTPEEVEWCKQQIPIYYGDED